MRKALFALLLIGVGGAIGWMCRDQTGTEGKNRFRQNSSRVSPDLMVDEIGIHRPDLTTPNKILYERIPISCTAIGLKREGTPQKDDWVITLWKVDPESPDGKREVLIWYGHPTP
jgi:hypothetical protein